MRTLTLLLATVGLAACATQPEPFNPGLLAEIAGNLERNANGSWTGTEAVRVLDYDGFVVCDGTMDIDAVEIPSAPSCDACEPTLETIRTPVRELAPDCHLEHEIAGWTDHVTHYLAFEHDRADKIGPLGTVMAGRDDGTWTYLARGVLEGDHLAYRDLRVWVEP